MAVVVLLDGVAMNIADEGLCQILIGVPNADAIPTAPFKDYITLGVNLLEDATDDCLLSIVPLTEANVTF